MNMVTEVDLSPERIKAALAEESAALEPFGFWDLSDGGLVRVRRQYLRMIEDNPGRGHAQIDAWLASIRWVRLVRWCLHMRYGAVDEHLGTKSYDRYYRFGEAPTYRLAREMDVANFELGRRHIIDWGRLAHRPSALTWMERMRPTRDTWPVIDVDANSVTDEGRVACLYAGDLEIGADVLARDADGNLCEAAVIDRREHWVQLILSQNWTDS